MDIINEYMKNNRIRNLLVKEVSCKDGFKMSVQASSVHYCSPRVDGGVYRSVEIAFPSDEESLIMEYAEHPEVPTKTVYGWVPVDIVCQVVEKHGGIKS